MNLNRFRNIVFDLGNVLIDIDPQKTIQGFKSMGFANIEDFLGHSRSMGFMAKFQEGKISEADFFAQVRHYAGLDLSDGAIADAWNAMLLDYDVRRIEKLVALKDHYRLFLYSNTNITHYHNFAFRVPRMGDISQLFERTFYSHEIGLAKPGVDGFEHVLLQAGINAADTLFLDDLPENVQGAIQVGMAARLVEYPNQWLEWM